LLNLGSEIAKLIYTFRAAKYDDDHDLEQFDGELREKLSSGADLLSSVAALLCVYEGLLVADGERPLPEPAPSRGVCGTDPVAPFYDVDDDDP
jgi:hypothetical protein